MEFNRILWQQKSCISRHDIMDIMLEYSFLLLWAVHVHATDRGLPSPRLLQRKDGED
ncbi:hypothetical protein P4H67_20550 [Paenibacillus lautus]|uniref:hypothetical protein n=1 Tax=Paenibacillus lautus TaxID=1401 RepID=UPI002DBED940|nr:hypothetical protein [Paenibacillus lautus]MEC0309155.1 hypothetical protein [Paenibacillus lautus]